MVFNVLFEFFISNNVIDLIFFEKKDPIDLYHKLNLQLNYIDKSLFK